MAKTAFSAKVSNTRPANTTAYAANDAAGATAAVWKFNTMGPAGGEIYITGSKLMIAVTAIPAGMTSFRLHLYSSTPTTALADNAAWTLHADDLSAYIGYLDLGSPALPAASSAAIYVKTKQDTEPFRLAPGCTDLWGYLVTAGGFTPAGNSEVYTLTLHSIAL